MEKIALVPTETGYWCLLEQSTSAYTCELKGIGGNLQ